MFLVQQTHFIKYIVVITVTNKNIHVRCRSIRLGILIYLFNLGGNNWYSKKSKPGSMWVTWQHWGGLGGLGVEGALVWGREHVRGAEEVGGLLVG